MHVDRVLGQDDRVFRQFDRVAICKGCRLTGFIPFNLRGFPAEIQDETVGDSSAAARLIAGHKLQHRQSVDGAAGSALAAPHAPRDAAHRRPAQSALVSMIRQRVQRRLRRHVVQAKAERPSESADAHAAPPSSGDHALNCRQLAVTTASVRRTVLTAMPTTFG